jgi:hypothetical protein
MTTKQFRDRFGRKVEQIQDELHEWIRNIELGNRQSVLLTEIDYGLIESGSRRYKSLVGCRVSGYQILAVYYWGGGFGGGTSEETVAVYCPMLRGFIRGALFNDVRYIYNLPYESAAVKHCLNGAGALGYQLPDWQRYQQRSNALRGQPIGDDDARTLMLANICKPPYQHRDEAFVDRYTEDKAKFMLEIVSSMKKDKDACSRLFSVLDTVGAPDTVFGEALKHMDKFRSF